MLPEVGATEWLIIAIVALIVIGPKDLPPMMRKLGQFVAKLRGMANEFRASFDEMARQSELDDLRKEVEAMRRGQFVDMSAHEHEMRTTVSEIEQSMAEVGVQLHPPMAYQYTPPAEPEPVAEPPPEPPAKAARKPRARKAPQPTAETAAEPSAEAKPRRRRVTKTAGDEA